MSKSRAPLTIGLVAAGAAGYYLYNAGGNPRAAEKKLESDAHRVSADIKQHLPGRDPNAEKGISDAGARLGSKLDAAAAEADKQIYAAKSNTEALAKDAKANAMKAVDDFDRKVEDTAAKAKGGVSSWFSSGNSK